MRQFECFNSLRILEDGSEFKYFGLESAILLRSLEYSGGEQERSKNWSTSYG